MFLSCRPFVVITTFSTGLVGVEVKGQKHTYIRWDDGRNFCSWTRVISRDLHEHGSYLEGDGFKAIDESIACEPKLWVSDMHSVLNMILQVFKCASLPHTRHYA